MKIDFLDATGGGEYPKASPKLLIRLSEFSNEEKLDLINAIEKIVLERREILKLHQLSFIESSSCLINLELGEENKSLFKSGSSNEFTCILSTSAYRDMIEIIKSVDDGHNWLTPGEHLDEPAFLISKWGSW